MTPAILAAAPSANLLYVSKVEAGRMRAAARGDRSRVLSKIAAKALQAGPWSVTNSRPPLEVGAGPNDYVSQAPYWWPDPQNPRGPYVRRDGRAYPERFTAHRVHLEEMCSAVLALAMGSFFLDRPDCSDRAALVLSTWFLDPRTRMNPHLEFGEVIVGRNKGRGAGIIATQQLMQVAQGITLLESRGTFDKSVAQGVRRWCAEYLTYLTTSKNGLSEKKSGNNHATWWTSQVATLALFTGNQETAALAWEHFREVLVPGEIRPDGSCPREESRTRSLHYSAMNLDAFALLCRLGTIDGAGLWQFRGPNGAGVATACSYLTPYLLNPASWKLEQITSFDPGIYYFPGLAGIDLPSPELLAAYRRLPRSQKPWVQFMDLLIAAAA